MSITKNEDLEKIKGFVEEAFKMMEDKNLMHSSEWHAEYLARILTTRKLYQIPKKHVESVQDSVTGALNVMIYDTDGMIPDQLRQNIISLVINMLNDVLKELLINYTDPFDTRIDPYNRAPGVGMARTDNPKLGVESIMDKKD